MTRTSSFSALILAFGLGLSITPQVRAIVWDDFQSYTPGQVLATGYLPQENSNSRWGRFGAGTADNPVPYFSFGPAAETVGDYACLWSIGNNGNLVYHFPTVTNLTATPGFSIQLMTDHRPETNTLILAVFEDSTGTIWQTKAENAQFFEAEYAWQTNYFEFNTDVMERVVGSGPFDLQSILNIRIRFQNPSGDTTPQHIYFWDLRSLPTKPKMGAPNLLGANTVTIPFTAEDQLSPDIFALEFTPTLGPSASWQVDPAAVFQSLGNGGYQVETTRSSASRFYRVRQ